jgi:branched-chain amino acid transport system permease protein
VTFTTLHVLTVVLSLGTISLLWLFLTKTRAGKAMRAVADNPFMAEAVGINRHNVFALAFGLGSAAAAMASVLWALDKGVLPTMAMRPLFTGFIVAIIGGIGSTPGALLGGLLLGLTENLSLLVVAPEMTGIISFCVLIAFLVLKPTGIFASKIKKLV